MKKQSTYLPVCSSGGRIEKLLLFHNQPENDPRNLWKAYAGMLRAFGPDVDCYIVAPFDKQPPVNQSAPAGTKRMHVVPMPGDGFTPGYSLTRWTQDVVHAFTRKAENGSDEMQLHYNAGRVDPEAFRQLKNYIPGLQFRPMHEPQLNGGNILISGNGGYLFAGADLLHWYQLGFTGAARKEAKTAAEKQLCERFGVANVYWLNTSARSGSTGGRQPFFHIDMYITIAGREGDRDLVFVGEIKEEYLFCPESEQINKLRIALDRTAEWMSNERNHPGLRCKVLRLPVLVFNAREEHFGCYNNCIVEEYANRRNLYLPDFMPALTGGSAPGKNAARIALIQEQLRLKLKTVGAGTVHYVSGDFYELSRKKGALRCRIKVIQRTHA